MASVTVAASASVIESISDTNATAAKLLKLADQIAGSLQAAVALDVTLPAGSTYNLTFGTSPGFGADADVIIAHGSGTIMAGFPVAGADGLGSNDITLSGDGASNLLFSNSLGGSIDLGSGAATVVASGLGISMHAGSGNAIIFDHSVDSVFVGGSGNATVFTGLNGLYVAGSGRTLFVADTGYAKIVAGSGHVTVSAGSADLDVVGGAGALTFIGGSVVSTVTGGSHTTTLFGAAGGEIDYSGSAGDGGGLLLAGDGNETLNAAGSSSDDTLRGGAGADQIAAGAGNDLIVAGTGSATITTGTGHDLFLFNNGEAGGSDVIYGFSGADVVALSGYGGHRAITAALATATTSGGSTTVTLTDNTRITFSGVASLVSSNFVVS